MSRAARVVWIALWAWSLFAIPSIAGADRGSVPRGEIVRVDHHPFENAPELGPRDALVTIELYFVPGSPASHGVYRVLLDLQRRHPTRVRAVFRPREQSAQIIIPAISLAAHARGKFFTLMNELTRSEHAPGAQATFEIAVRLGLDRALLSRAHIDDAITNVLRENYHRYFRLEATSLPAMVLNGRLTSVLYDRSVTVDELEGEYQNALDAARFARGQGVPKLALANASARHIGCGDNGIAEQGDHVRSPGRSEPAQVHEPPMFHWHLGALARRGTGCPPSRHVGGRLDDGDPIPEIENAYLLTTPLPVAGMPSTGPSDAPVTVHVLCNLRSSACGEQLERARRVADHFTGEVRVVYRPWIDLTREGSSSDVVLSEAALCAAASGNGWSFLHKATGGDAQAQNRHDLAQLAHTAGLDADELIKCAKGQAPRTAAALAAAQAAGIGWGPTVVIGARAYVGGFSDDRPEAEAIEAELAPGLLETLIPTY